MRAEHDPAGVLAAQPLDVGLPGWLRSTVPHEALRGRGLRVGEDLEDAARLDHAPGVQHGDAVGDRADHLHLVGDDDDGDAELAVDPLQQREDVGGRLGVERAGRLVGEQDVGLGRERPGDADALLLAAGELVGIAPRLVGQPDEVEQLGDPLLALVRGQPATFSG